MSSMIKYGHYYISAAILVAGVVWLNRPADPRVMGEDTADIFEQVQEVLVVPYLTGTQVPDWESVNSYGNAYPSNSIYSPTKYQDILNMANKVRQVVTKSDGAIFWTSATFSNTAELAVSYGSYCDTQEVAGYVVDELNGGGWAVTNRYYQYSTNTFADTIVTTASRQWTNNSLFHETITTDDGSGPIYTAVSLTNVPLANLVYGRGAALSLSNTNGFQTAGSGWPFEWSYAFPWEQWSYPTHSRVTMFAYSASNVAYTNLFWLSTNSLALTFNASLTDTNNPGYSLCSIMDVSGHTSIQSAYVQPPSAASPIYLYNYSGGPYETDYSINKTWAQNWQINFYIKKEGAAAYESLAWSIVAGDYLFMYSGGGGPSYQFLDVMAYPEPYYPGYPIPTPTNSLSVLKIWVPAQTNVAPIYVAISVKTAAYAKTNAYFNVTSDLSTSSAITATATSNAVASAFTATDDRRITTNKLNAFAQILTNLNRTVYIGGINALTCTGRTEIVYSHPYTNYVSEFEYGSGDAPAYYDSYTKADLLADFSAITQTATNNYAATSPIYFAETLFSFQERGLATIDSTPEWWSYVTIFGYSNERKHNAFTGCSVVYPSLWALTNNFVAAVKVYAVAEAIETSTESYYSWTALGDFYSHTVDGEYWNQGNFGISSPGLTFNTPSHSVPSTRINGLDRQYYGAGNLGLTDRAIFTKIYETNSPTGPITFDLPERTITHADPASRYAYFDWTTASSGPREIGWQYLYSVGYRLNYSRIMIVVDWNFTHLGRGFTPATNTPAWRP